MIGWADGSVETWTLEYQDVKRKEFWYFSEKGGKHRWSESENRMLMIFQT
jgi:hypothetical protein